MEIAVNYNCYNKPTNIVFTHFGISSLEAQILKYLIKEGGLEAKLEDGLRIGFACNRDGRIEACIWRPGCVTIGDITPEFLEKMSKKVEEFLNAILKPYASLMQGITKLHGAGLLGFLTSSNNLDTQIKNLEGKIDDLLSQNRALESRVEILESIFQKKTTSALEETYHD